MDQAGLLKFIDNVFSLLNFSNTVEAPQYHGDISLLKNGTAIGIALLYLNHACHYHDVFA